jgi:hypothetical protein
MESKQEILLEGIAALRSLHREAHAISTPYRFKQFCLEEKIECVDQYHIYTGEFIRHNGKIFELIDHFKQTGYCAKHIGSKLDEIRNSGREPLVINLPRNKRLVFASLNGAI